VPQWHGNVSLVLCCECSEWPEIEPKYCQAKRARVMPQKIKLADLIVLKLFFTIMQASGNHPSIAIEPARSTQQHSAQPQQKTPKNPHKFPAQVAFILAGIHNKQLPYIQRNTAQ
jgi:hypothetical protein